MRNTGLSEDSKASSSPSLASASLLSLENMLSRLLLMALISSGSESDSPWILEWWLTESTENRQENPRKKKKEITLCNKGYSTFDVELQSTHVLNFGDSIKRKTVLETQNIHSEKKMSRICEFLRKEGSLRQE